ncbi:hypothetical protein [Lysobacter solisilvae (ex Woo and Kim 2020)]|uniref:Uncharacterized protein n=1 Tax=Agrilutibacter terrestris TaxID=2865112 RepID=A0A7H0FU54_9GAMM|nr:hypothetical protein [Lysobacter terrestris]QNP39570.1 hypothetical protein H8B22_08500 [Lysobacter terrestris]
MSTRDFPTAETSARLVAGIRRVLPALLALPLLAGTARAGDLTEAFTGVPHKQLVAGLAPAAAAGDVSVVAPIGGQAPTVLGMATITLRPAQCHLAFENALGSLYACQWRTALVQGATGPISAASRHRVALWHAREGERAAAFVFYDLEAAEGDEALLKAVQKKRFGIVSITASEWNANVRPGRQDTSAILAMDSAAKAAVAAMDRPDEFKLLHAVDAPAPDQAVIWGDLRAFGEVLVQKLDGKTMWHVPLNGYAQAIATTPGAHRLDLVLIAGAGAPRDYEQPLDVNLNAGHTYVVGFGIDDKPAIEDLGVGVRCERRKAKMMMAASYRNAWLACRTPEATQP